MTDQPEAQPQPQPWIGPAEQKYANAVNVGAGPFDLMLVFGLAQAVTVGSPGLQAHEITEVVRVSMSWGHAKSMIPLLAKMVADYEQQYGEVPAPGFGENWKA